MASLIAWPISSISGLLASRTASAALRLSVPAVRFIVSKLSMTPLVAVAVFSVSMRLTAVARSSAVFSVSAMMRVNDCIRPSSSSLRALEAGGEAFERRAAFLDGRLDLLVDLGEVAASPVSDVRLLLEAVDDVADAVEDVARDVAEARRPGPPSSLAESCGGFDRVADGRA